MFQLHPQLAADCHELLQLEGFRILLHRNAVVGWIIIVPEVTEGELFEVPKVKRERLYTLWELVAAFAKEYFRADKINVAAIGNLVPQLHLHVVARKTDDPAWPAPVWGNLTEAIDYSAEQVEAIRSALKEWLSMPG